METKKLIKIELFAILGSYALQLMFFWLPIIGSEFTLGIIENYILLTILRAAVFVLPLLFLLKNKNDDFIFFAKAYSAYLAFSSIFTLLSSVATFIPSGIGSRYYSFSFWGFSINTFDIVTSGAISFLAVALWLKLSGKKKNFSRKICNILFVVAAGAYAVKFMLYPIEAIAYKSAGIAFSMFSQITALAILTFVVTYWFRMDAVTGKEPEPKPVVAPAPQQPDVAPVVPQQPVASQVAYTPVEPQPVVPQQSADNDGYVSVDFNNNNQ